jgi:Tol biopolymer transport system component
MTTHGQRWRGLAAAFVAGIAGIGGSEGQATRPADSSFDAALVHPADNKPVLTLFTTSGRQITIPLPPDLPPNLTVNAFSQDGRAIYVQEAAFPERGVVKIEFRPTRRTTMRGMVGLRSVWSLTVPDQSGQVFFSGLSKSPGECGTFVVDPNSGALRSLLAGVYPDCGGGGGPVSPTGRKVLSYASKELEVIDLETGAVQSVRGIPGKASRSRVTWQNESKWSPDGRWISTIGADGRIELIEAADLSRQRNLGPSGGASPQWSPDSKYLLLLKSEFRCAQYLYFNSLESIEVATGRRKTVPGSRCEVGPGWYGWLDERAVR